MPKPRRFRNLSTYQHRSGFALLVLQATWSGSPTTLANGVNVNLSQTPNGTLLFSWLNTGKQNNMGSLSLTSGGGAPISEQAPPLANQPSALLQNWQGNNLSVTNTSTGPATPIWIAAYGPGLPGNYPVPLPSDGTEVSLGTLATAAGTTLARYMVLTMACTSGTLALAAVIGGPPDATGNNGYLIALNAAADTGPNGPTPPAGYYATTTGNTYRFQFNWGAASIFVAVMSPFTTPTVDVALMPL